MRFADSESRCLIVIAGETDAPTGDDSAWVLRLAGGSRAGESLPPNLLDAADLAAEDLRNHYPEWLWRWTTDSGALSLAHFPGPLSWWWYTPVSEKSCLRSRLMSDLYRLTLVRRVLRSHPEIRDVEWHGGDRLLAATAERLVASEGRSFRSLGTIRQRGSRFSRLAARRGAYTAYALLRWLLFRVLRIPGESAIDRDTDVLFFTRFPNTWDTSSRGWRERMYGDLPQYLANKGHGVSYVAAPFGPVRRLIAERRRWRRESVRVRIGHLEARMRFIELLRCHLTIRLFARYLMWRLKERRAPVTYAGIDVGDLLWREMDASVLSPEIPADLVTSASLAEVVNSLPRLRVVFTVFEYQPCERAVAAALRSREDVTLVGTQAGIYTANQMGWNLYGPEIDRAWEAGQGHHIPDLVCAFGELPHRVFASGLGEDRVGLVGPVRFSFDRAEGERKPADGATVLVATPSLRSEAIALVETAIPAMAQAENSVVHFKFHPLLPLDEDVREIASSYDELRYRIVDEPIGELLRHVEIMICGGSSTAMEAVACGCMPLVYRSAGELAANPMLHVPEAAFFWTSVEELRGALSSCLIRDEAYERKRATWPNAISEHLYRIDDLTNERVYDYLSEHRVLAATADDAQLLEGELTR